MNGAPGPDRAPEQIGECIGRRARQTDRMAGCPLPWLLALLAACASAPPPPAPRHLGPITSLAWHGDVLVSTSRAGVCWHAPGGVAAWRRTPLRAFAALPLTDRRSLLVGGTPGRSGEIAHLLLDEALSYRKLALDVLYAAAISPDGQTAALAGADGRTILIDLPGLVDRAAFHDHTATCRAVAFTTDGTHLVSVGLDSVVVIRALAGNQVHRAVDHTAGVECLALCADDDAIASGARDGKVRVHERSGRLRHTFARLGGAVLAVAWLDRDTVLAGLDDGRLVALGIAGDTRRELARYPSPIFALAVSGSGALAVGTEGEVDIAADLTKLARR